MSPKHHTRHESRRGRCRGISQKKRVIERDLSPNETISDNVSTEENESLKQLPIKNHAVNGEIEISLYKLESNFSKSNILDSIPLMNQEYNLTNAKLDLLQGKLESMLSSAIVRKNIITNQQDLFKSMQLDCSQQSTVNNPKHLYKPIAATVAADILPTNDNCEINIVPYFVNNGDNIPLKQNKVAKKFWSLVEPYLAHVKKEDLEWLENLVKSYDSNNLYEIPPLGNHYANYWAQEELEIEKEQLCSQSAMRIKLFEQITPDMTELVDKIRYTGHNSSVYAPIYQRVIKAILTSQCYQKDFGENDLEDKPRKMSKICKEFYTEQNIKKQLYRLGMISHHTKPVLSLLKANSDEDCDEILEELNKCKTMLAELQINNKIQLTKLFEKCNKDYCQQVIINKLKKLDEKILNFGKRQYNLLQKGKKYVQYLKNGHDLHSLLDKHNYYLKQLELRKFEPNDSITSFNLNASESDDSDSSEEHVIKRFKYNTSMEQEIETE